ncbi:helix-turn-helix domain-containing protein [Streptomyces aureus]
MPRLAKPATGKYADFARSVRALRDATGLSVQDLSDASGVPPSSIYAAESGTRLPTEENFTAMAPALGIDIEDARRMRQSAFAHAFLAEVPKASRANLRTLQTHADLAAFLASLRIRAGALPLRILARQTGVSASALSRVFQGKALVPWHSLHSVLEALGATELEQAEVLACWRRLQSDRASRPSSQTLALLYGTATSCAYPGCAVPLVEWDGEQPRVTVEIAHIEPISETPHSDQFDNLILLCPQHHHSHGEAGPEDLRAWKRDQAARARETARPHRPPQDTGSATPLPPALDEASIAFQGFFAQCRDPYLAYARLHLGTRTDAEAVVHQALARIHAAWDRLLMTNDPYKGSFDILQSSISDALQLEHHDPAAVINQLATPHLGRKLRLQGAGPDVLEKITELPPQEYNVFVFRQVLNLSVRETAHLMGLAQASIRSLERTAKRRLDASAGRSVNSVTAERGTSST